MSVLPVNDDAAWQLEVLKFASELRERQLRAYISTAQTCFFGFGAVGLAYGLSREGTVNPYIVLLLALPLVASGVIFLYYRDLEIRVTARTRERLEELAAGEPLVNFKSALQEISRGRPEWMNPRR